MSIQYDEENLRRCIANLCLFPDIDLINALLDNNDQLLANFQCDYDSSTLSFIIKAFRQLHSQLKKELTISCALNGRVCNETFPLRLLSILKKRQQDIQNPPAVDGLPVGNEDEEKIHFEFPKPNEKICVSNEKKLSDCAESIESTIVKEIKKNGAKRSDAEKTQKGVLELQFINAFSLGFDDKESGELVDRSVQVESDLLNFSVSSHADKLNATKESPDEEKLLQKCTKNVKEDEELVESVSAASLCNGRESSSFSTTPATNSANSTELSVGEVDRRRVTRLLVTRNDIKIYNVDADGAFLTSAEKRKRLNGRREQYNSATVAATGSDDEHVEVLSAKQITLERDCRRRQPPTQEPTFQSSFGTAKLLNALNDEEKNGVGAEGGGQIRKDKVNGAKGEEEEEEQSTLNQVTPIPTTLELSSSS